MTVYLKVFSVLMLIVGLYSIITTLLNLRHFKRLGNVKDDTDGPLISVIIPARNEEKNISRLLDSMLAQTYKNIEILVINDQSSDKTASIIHQFEKKDSRVRYFETEEGKKLNNNGKINALLQVIEHAKGEYILATDADTAHSAECISHAYSVMRKSNLDIISGFPTEICPSFMGTVDMSAMMLTTIMIPHFLVYRFPIPSACFAIGQFIMMRREAYYETGGYSCIKGNICDDVGIVRLFVRKKKKYAFISIADYVKCYMYGTRREAFKGIERSIAGVLPPNIFTFFPLLLVAIALLHLALCPILAIIFRLTVGPSPFITLLMFGWIVFYLAWYIGCRTANWRKRISISCPITLIETSLMYLHGLYMGLMGKEFEWKGRKLSSK